MEESSDSLTSDSDGNGGDPNDRIIRAYQRVEDRGQPLGLQISQGSLRIRNDVEGGRVTGLAPRSMMRLRQRLQLRDSGDHGAGSSGAAAGADLTEENGEHRSREAQRIWNEMAAVEEQAKIDLECEEASFFGSSIVVLTRDNKFGLLGTENLVFVFADAREHDTIPVRGGAANSGAFGASSGPPATNISNVCADWLRQL
ncbi:hypothetical protein VPH35_097502 [Triticum aestivum]